MAFKDLARNKNWVGKLTYVLYTAVIAGYLAPKLIFLIISPEHQVVYLYFLSLPGILVLSALSVLIQKYYRSQTRIFRRIFLLIANALIVFGSSLLITMLVVG